MPFIIYKITNTINGKSYIGQTTRSLKERIYGHRSSLRYDSNRRKCSALVAAFKKYGFDNFEFKEICRCFSIDELNEEESNQIKKHKTLCPMGYNISIGGGNTFKTDLVREKMSKNHPSKKDGYTPFNQKSYTMYRNGEKVQIVNMKKFCRENGLPYRKMITVANRGYGHCKGYSPVKNWDEKKYKQYRYIKDGKEILISNLAKYCKENNLSRAKMISLHSGHKVKYKDFFNYDIYNDEYIFDKKMKRYNAGYAGYLKSKENCKDKKSYK